MNRFPRRLVLTGAGVAITLPWLRVVAVTWCPATTSCGTRCRPTAPVAPATKTFMVGSFPFVVCLIQNSETKDQGPL